MLRQRLAAGLLCGYLAVSLPAFAAEPVLTTIDTAQSAALIEQHQGDKQFSIIDVRTPEEYAEGHLTGSQMIDYYDADFADQLQQLDKDKTYLIYCRSGGRSGRTLKLMEQMGFSSVYNMSGGFSRWQGEQRPSE